MRAGFPTPPKTTLGEPNLFILNDLLQYICKCAQTHKSTISTKMNLLYVAVDPSLYTHYSACKGYPQDMYPFPDNVDEVPDFTTCPNNNECAAAKFFMQFYSKCKMTLSTWMPRFLTPSSVSSRLHSSYSMSKKGWWIPMQSSNNALIGLYSSTDALWQKIAKPIGWQWWLPTGTPQWILIE